MEHHSSIALRDVYAARARIAPYIRRTSLVRSEFLSASSGKNVFLKLETEQKTHSFKVRGAANRLLQLCKDEREQGVVTVSTGNHGKAVAAIARELNIRAVVCVPQAVLPHKVDAICALGAEIVVSGADQEEAEAHAGEIAADRGLTLISPFDEPAIIAGQGTIGLEILEDLPEVDMVVVPLSGGGLMSGIALAIKEITLGVQMVGVSMERSPVMYWSLRAGRPITMPEIPTLADSLMGGIGLENRYTFDLVRKYVDETVLVNEDEIASAMVTALQEEHAVVEGGGAVSIAALQFEKIAELGDNIVVVVSGGNADMDRLHKLAATQAPTT